MAVRKAILLTELNGEKRPRWRFIGRRRSNKYVVDYGEVSSSASARTYHYRRQSLIGFGRIDYFAVYEFAARLAGVFRRPPGEWMESWSAWRHLVSGVEKKRRISQFQFVSRRSFSASASLTLLRTAWRLTRQYYSLPAAQRGCALLWDREHPRLWVGEGEVCIPSRVGYHARFVKTTFSSLGVLKRTIKHIGARI